MTMHKPCYSAKYTEHGVPILTLREKLDALQACLLEEPLSQSDEDAMGHLCDIFHHVWKMSLQPYFNSKQDAWEYYSQYPVPIKDWREVKVAKNA